MAPTRGGIHPRSFRPIPVLFVPKDGTGAQKGLSVSMIQSPEWTGPLTIGRAVDNYTMSIVGTHTS